MAAAVLVLGLGALASAAGPARDDERESAAVLDQLLGELLGLGELPAPEVQRRVGEAGGVAFLADVPVQFLTLDALGRYLHEVVESEYPPAEAEADGRLLAAFDLLEPGTDLRRLRLKLLEENVAGFYDERPDRRRLYVVSDDESLTPMNQVVLAHEMRHALQDQHARVHSILPESVGDFDDRRLAYLAVLEGDATLVMAEFLSRRVQDAGLPAADITDFTFPVGPMPGAPSILRDQMVLPYSIGTPFVRELRRTGGWEAVRQAWKHPPESTEQVLHPEKYHAGEAPQTIALEYAPAGATLLRDGVLGEAYLRTLLGEDVSPDAAAGWAGDRFRLWDRRGRTLLVWHSRWDTEADAREFASALEIRYAASHARQPLRGDAVSFRRGSWSVALLRCEPEVRLVASDDPAAFHDALKLLGQAAKGGLR